MRGSLPAFVMFLLASTASGQPIGLTGDRAGEVVPRKLREVGEDEPVDDTIVQIDALSVAERVRLANALGSWLRSR